MRPVDKDVLVQYREMKKEVKDLRRRIEKLNRFLADRFRHGERNQERRNHWSDQSHRHSRSGDFAEAESQGAIQKVARGEGGGAAGTDRAGGGVHRQY